MYQNDHNQKTVETMMWEDNDTLQLTPNTQNIPASIILQ